MRRHGTRFWLAMLLSLSMVVTMIPMYAYGAGSGGSPENDRYRIVALNGYDSRFRLGEVLIGEPYVYDQYETATPGYAFVGSTYNYALRVDGNIVDSGVTWSIDQPSTNRIVDYTTGALNQSQLTFTCNRTGTITVTAFYNGSAVRKATITVAGSVSSGNWGDNITWEIDSSGKLTFTGTGEMAGRFFGDDGEQAATQKYDEYSRYSDLVTSVEIKSGITSVGSCAFDSFNSITSVTLPSSITSIGDDAFWGCSSLKSITIPDKVTRIEDGTFSKCSSLKSIELPESITYIGWDAFYKCNAVTNFTMPESTKEIAGSAFSGCNNLKYVKFNSVLKTIGAKAFYNCPRLTTVDMSDSITLIESAAFKNCTMLAEIAWPKNLECIEAQAFSFSGITDAKLPDGISEIGDEAFLGCESLQSVELPDSIDRIQQSTFRGCTALESLVISKNIVNIEKNAFYSCSRLSEINLPSKLESIGNCAFGECSKLTAVVIPDSVSNIGNGAFECCTSLENIVFPRETITIPSNVCCATAINRLYIPEGVQRIRYGAFSNCKNLEYVSIPDSVVSIEEEAFAYCDNLHSVLIPETVTSLGYASFGMIWRQVSEAGYESDYDETFTIEGIKNSAAEEYANDYGLRFFEVGAEAVRISDCTISPIPDQSYKGSPVIPAITIVDPYGRTLKQGVDFTVSCSNNNQVGTATAFINGDGVRYKGQTTKKFTITSKKDISEYSVSAIDVQTYTGEEIKPSVEVVDANNTLLVEGRDYEVSYSNNIEPSSHAKVIVTGINNYCGQLTATFTIESNFRDKGYCGKDNVGDIEWVLSDNGTLTLSGSGDMANYMNSSAPWQGYSYYIKKVVVGDGITTVGSFAFAYFNNLTTVELGKDITDIGTCAFYYDEQLTSIDIPASVENIYGSAFYSCRRLREVTLRNGLKTIGEYAFEYCNSLTSIVFPNTVQTVGFEAFRYCSNLVSATLSDSMETIPDRLFSNCTLLSSIVIPDRVKTVGYYAFQYCSALSTVVLPDKLEHIGTQAFSQCRALKSVTIPRGVYFGELDNYGNLVGYNNDSNSIFEGCTGLKSVTFEEGIQIVPPAMFIGCKNLSMVQLSKSLKAIMSQAFDDCESLKQIVIPENVIRLDYNCLGYYHNTLSGKQEKVQGFTINGYAGSEAEWYAESNGFPFNLICEHDLSQGTGLKVVAYQAPTCTKDGHEKYLMCPDCGMIFKEVLEKRIVVGYEATTMESMIIKATGHNWNYSQKDEDGRYHCFNCDATTTVEPEIVYECWLDDLVDVPDNIYKAGYTSIEQIGDALYDKVSREGFADAILDLQECTITHSENGGFDWTAVPEGSVPSKGVNLEWLYSNLDERYGTDILNNPEKYDFIFAQMSSFEGDAGTIKLISDFNRDDWSVSVNFHTSGPIMIGILEKETYKLSGDIEGVDNLGSATVTATLKKDPSVQKSAIVQNGAYTITGLNPGTYEICAYANGCIGRKTTATVSDNTSQDVELRQIGDTNCDGKITATDVTVLARHIAHLEECDDEYVLQLFDTDHNGKVSASDATHFARYLAGIIDNL